jgi:hypothetical protein
MVGGMTVTQSYSHPSTSQIHLMQSNAIRFLNKVIVQPAGKKLLEKDYQGPKLSSL